MLVLLNEWNRVFFDALQNKNQDVFLAQLGRFTWLAMVFIVIAVYRFYLTQLLQVRWRAWMTRDLMHRWLGGQAFYRMELQRYTGAPEPDGEPLTTLKAYRRAANGITFGQNLIARGSGVVRVGDAVEVLSD